MRPPPPRCRLRRGVAERLRPLRRASDGLAPALATVVELVDDGEALRARFRCEDPEPWATLVRRDADLWTEEVVEVFLAPGGATPAGYAELELNPLGTCFDAWVSSPRGDRRDLALDRGWECAGGAVAAARTASGWSAELAIPWRALAGGEAAPRLWRANFFRIDRPRAAPAEFSAWSPTWADPPDFHRADRFGFLERLG